MVGEEEQPAVTGWLFLLLGWEAAHESIACMMGQVDSGSSKYDYTNQLGLFKGYAKWIFTDSTNLEGGMEAGMGG